MGASDAVSPGPFVLTAVVLLAILPVATPLNIPQSDAGTGFTTITAIVFLGGISMIWKGLNDLKLLRLIGDTPTSDIGSVASGDVELKGTARQMDHALEAPFSNRRCLLYDYRIEEFADNGRSKRWKEVASGSTREPFALEDETGAAAVRPSDADLEIEWTQVAATNGQQEPPEPIQSFIRESPEVDFEHDDFLWTGNRRRYHERILAPESDVYIFGEASTYSDSSVKEIRKGQSPIYIISDESEEDLTSDFSTWYKIFIPSGVIAGILGYAGLYASLL